MGQVSFAREFGALAEVSQAGEERSFDVLHKTSREFCKMCDANVELECRCVSLFADCATSTLAEMFSIEISQAP